MSPPVGLPALLHASAAVPPNDLVHGSLFLFLAQAVEEIGAFAVQIGAVGFETSAVGANVVLQFDEAAAAVVEMSGELGFLLLQSAASLQEPQFLFRQRGLLCGDSSGVNTQSVENIRR